MRKVRDILRLKAQGLTARQIAVSVGPSRSTITECLHRVEGAGLAWPLPATLSDTALEAALYPPRAAQQRGPRRCPIGRACIRSCIAPA